MISAPMPGPQAAANASSTPPLPPGWPCMAWKLRVANNHSCNRVPACPNGASRLCPSPVPNPSSDTEKLCTRTRDIGVLLHNDMRRSAGWLPGYTARTGRDHPP